MFAAPLCISARWTDYGRVSDSSGSLGTALSAELPLGTGNPRHFGHYAPVPKRTIGLYLLQSAIGATMGMVLWLDAGCDVAGTGADRALPRRADWGDLHHQASS